MLGRDGGRGRALRNSAIATCQRTGARPWLAHTESAYAAMLASRGRPEDRCRAFELATAARDAADEMGMTALTERVESFLAQLVAPTPAISDEAVRLTRRERGGRQSRRHRYVQPADRRAPVRLRAHGRDARPEHPHQARVQLPQPGRRLGGPRGNRNHYVGPRPAARSPYPIQYNHGSAHARRGRCSPRVIRDAPKGASMAATAGTIPTRPIATANEEHRAVLPAEAFDPYMTLVLDLKLSPRRRRFAADRTCRGRTHRNRDVRRRTPAAERWGGTTGVSGLRAMAVEPAGAGRDGIGATWSLSASVAPAPPAPGRSRSARPSGSATRYRLYERCGFVGEPERDRSASELMGVPTEVDFVALAYRLDLDHRRR